MSAPTKFLIAGTQRTGTTLIRTSLSSHPNILCRGEVFLLGKHPYRDRGGYWHYSRLNFGNRMTALLSPSKAVASYLRNLFGNPGYSAIGFKIMLNQCKSRPYIWTELLKHEVKAILVRRRNVLKTLTSRRAAESTGVYHVSRNLKKASSVERWVAPKISLNVATLTSDLEAIESEHTSWKSRLSDHVEHIEIGYEEYVGDPVAANSTILAFLGVPNVSLESDLKKVNPDNLSELIENYDDVVKRLQGSRFAQFLT